MKRNATIDFVENMFMCAAKYDNIEVLEWLKRNKCPWDSHTFFFAALRGNIKVLEWLKKNKCPWGLRYILFGSSTWQYGSKGMAKKECC